jgi:hypothetical protein
MRAAEREDLLRVLRAELAFLQRGGYQQPASAEWRPQYVFQDSPTCIKNRDLLGSPRCEECPLIRFVPEAQRESGIPCEHIPLNESRETLDWLYRTASMEEVEAAVGEWLGKMIAELEADRVDERVEVVVLKAGAR